MRRATKYAVGLTAVLALSTGLSEAAGAKDGGGGSTAPPPGPPVPASISIAPSKIALGATVRAP